MESFSNEGRSRGVRNAFMELRTGSVRENDIQNAEHIESFAKYGVWVRALLADQIIEKHKVNNATSPTFVSCVVGVYQQVGNFLEDIISMMAAWGTVNSNPNMLIADILGKIIIKPESKEYRGKIPYHEKIFDELCNKKIVYIDSFEFAKSIYNLKRENAIKLFGVNWSKHRSKKFYLGHKENWNFLPTQFEFIFDDFVEEKSDYQRIIHNKIKHGPQLIICNPVEKLNERGGNFGKEEISLYSNSVVRILMRGARTQEKNGEYQCGKSVAPFLDGSPNNLKKMIRFGIVEPAFAMENLAFWIFKELTGREIIFPDDENVYRLKKEWFEDNLDIQKGDTFRPTEFH